VLVRILISAAIAVFILAWVRAVRDISRRRDLTRAAKWGWAIILLLVPLLGLLFYALIRPSESQIAQRARR
jgi:hypothetical protein